MKIRFFLNPNTPAAVVVVKPDIGYTTWRKDWWQKSFVGMLKQRRTISLVVSVDLRDIVRFKEDLEKLRGVFSYDELGTNKKSARFRVWER